MVFVTIPIAFLLDSNHALISKEGDVKILKMNDENSAAVFRDIKSPFLYLYDISQNNGTFDYAIAELGRNKFYIELESLKSDLVTNLMLGEEHFRLHLLGTLEYVKNDSGVTYSYRDWNLDGKFDLCKIYDSASDGIIEKAYISEQWIDVISHESNIISTKQGVYFWENGWCR